MVARPQERGSIHDIILAKAYTARNATGLMHAVNFTGLIQVCHQIASGMLSVKNRLAGFLNSWEICQRCAKILLAAEHKMQLAYCLRNTDWFQRCSEFGLCDEPFIILFTIFY